MFSTKDVKEPVPVTRALLVPVGDCAMVSDASAAIGMIFSSVFIIVFIGAPLPSQSVSLIWIRNGFVFGGGSGCVFLRFGVENGFVWYFFTEGFEALEFLNGVAVVALGLGLIAEEEGPGGGVLAVHVMEACGEAVEAILHAGFFLHHVGIAVEVLMQGDEGGFVLDVEEGSVERVGEEAGFEASDAEEVVLGEGDAFDGEEFLRVDGAVDGEEVGAEAIDRFAVFDFDDGEVGAVEAMLAGVLGGAGLAERGEGSSGEGGVGAVGGELFVSWHNAPCW